MVKVKVPATLGGCADALFKLRAEKAKLQHVIDGLDTIRRAVEERLIQELKKGEAGGVVGKLAKAVVKTKDVPSVHDWDKLQAHILKTKSFALLQRRINDGAWRELAADGKKVPGVEPFTVVTVSVTKL